mgnify:CR=1 FL=1
MWNRSKEKALERQERRTQRLKREDFEVGEYLKAEDPELFKTLRKAAKSKNKKPA